MEKTLSFASFCCLNNVNHPSSTLLISSSAFPRSRKAFSSSSSTTIPVQSQPSIRRPDVDRWSNPASTSAPARPPREQSDDNNSSISSGGRDELELFLELVPARMRRELAKHEEIRELIEIVMDLGRKPIARFPSGDWIISQQTVNLEDLSHAVSKVLGKFIDQKILV